MKKILSAEVIVKEALELLNETGIEGVSTRKLAKRLGVEQPALYWHFKNKDMLLQAMAHAAMLTHWDFPIPVQGDNLKKWFISNLMSFRKSLLMYRDGARLHAYDIPDNETTGLLEQKLGFIIGHGIAAKDAKLALMTASRFTVGYVLEEQQERGFVQLDKSNPFFKAEKNNMYVCGLELIFRGSFSQYEGDIV